MAKRRSSRSAALRQGQGGPFEPFVPGLAALILWPPREESFARHLHLEGAAPAYSQTTVPLPDSAAGTTIKIRFHFHSDANTSVPQGGWWVDDAAITAETH